MILQSKNLKEFIAHYQVDAVKWKAHRLLSDIDNTVLRNDQTRKVATMLAAIPDSMGVMRDDYIKEISKQHNIVRKTIEKYVAEAVSAGRKKTAQDQKKEAVKKNKSLDLKEDPRTYRFFTEFPKQDKDGQQYLDRIKVDKEKFVRLLSSFGFSRYEPKTSVQTKDKDEFTFVRLQGNVISSVTRNQIIDYIEKFVRNEYDFDGAKYEFTDGQALISALYDQIRTIFSKDLFARMRTEEAIIINTDTKDSTFLYYQNGFVEITKNGWKLRPYEEMSGSVWEHQMLNRKFSYLGVIDGTEYVSINGRDLTICKAGYFVDFLWKVSNENEERFKALCCIIGYLIHDFYDYKLKAVELTDSSLSQSSEGRTGKTLFGTLISRVRSYCEINGKDFNAV